MHIIRTMVLHGTQVTKKLVEGRKGKGGKENQSHDIDGTASRPSARSIHRAFPNPATRPSLQDGSAARSQRLPPLCNRDRKEGSVHV